MRFKEFIKPNLYKILIFILIVVILYLIPHKEYYECHPCPPEAACPLVICEPVIETPMLWWLWDPIMFSYGLSGHLRHYFYKFHIPKGILVTMFFDSLFLFFLIWIISCLIYTIFSLAKYYLYKENEKNWK